jgi:hypothetical protein
MTKVVQYYTFFHHEFSYDFSQLLPIFIELFHFGSVFNLKIFYR